jgi:hypothetical protein
MAARTMTRVRCPYCRLPVDAVYGAHVNCGQGLDPIPRRVTAAMLIREHATVHDILSANDLRAAFDHWGIPETARGPAFGAAVKAGVIRKTGHTPSTDPATKKHDIQTYVSLISRTAMLERRTA